MSNVQCEAVQSRFGAPAPSRKPQADGGIADQLQRLVGAVAVALVMALLVALATLGGVPTSGESGESVGRAVGAEPVLDGRGKWSGYAR